MAESSDRNGAARVAAETLLQDRQGIQQPSLRNYGAARSEWNARRRIRKVCCGFMTDARRTFCLIVTFDLILTFVLWGIFVQLKEPKNENKTSAKCNQTEQFSLNFCDEIVDFTFGSSLFDVMMCGVARFLFLILAYGLFRLENPSVIAITTFFTSLYIIVKVFLFHNYGNNPPSYLLLILSFIIAWVETWFLDFRVLPYEKSAVPRLPEGDGPGDEHDPLLRPQEPDSDFGTPEEASDIEDDEGRGLSYRGPRGSVNSEYRRKAEDAWKQAWYLINMRNGWKQEMIDDGIAVESQTFANLGKVFRIEATVDASASNVFQITTMNFSELQTWNPTVMESKILQSLGPSMDVTYSVTATAGRGMVSSRDFVTVRQWKCTDSGAILSAGTAVVHHMMPPQAQHVRGENRISGWLFQPLLDNPNQCILKMVICSDIKGWIPQVIVDQALTGVLVDSIRYLRCHISRQRLAVP